MREHRRIRLPTGPRRWTASEIRLLGRFTDAELTRRLRRSYETVRRQRLALHIPSLRPLPWKLWTRAEEKLVGKIPDKELARRLGRSLNSVKAHRILLGLQKYHLRLKPWTDEEERLLGTAQDSAIAARLGRKAPAIAARRHLLRIPPAPFVPRDGWKPAEDRLLWQIQRQRSRSPTGSSNGRRQRPTSRIGHQKRGSHSSLYPGRRQTAWHRL